MRRIKFLLSGLVLAASCHAGEGLWSVGLKTQGTIDFEPGNDYFSGAEIGYSNYHMASHRLQLKFSYLTSRLEQVFRPNTRKQDYFLFTPSWHFRRNRFFDPVIQADLGNSRYDLDNDAWIAALQAGANLNFSQGQWGLHYHLGYNLLIPKSSVAFPGVFGLELWLLL